MRLKNSTKIPDDTIREIINFVKPSGISKFDVMVKNSQKAFYGRAYYQGSGYHSSADPFVVVRVGIDERFPMPPSNIKYKGYLPRPYFANRLECFLYVLAHELRHIWQSKVKKGYRVWGSKGQFSERDADAYAIRKLREWRKTK